MADKNFDELEKMRIKLEERGAFKQFEKRVEEPEAETKEEDNEYPYALELEPTSRKLTIGQAEKLKLYFTKKEIVHTIGKNKLEINPNKKISDILIAMSEYGVKPKIPKRVVWCAECGKGIMFDEKRIKDEKIDPIYYCFLNDKEFLCEECKKSL